MTRELKNESVVNVHQLKGQLRSIRDQVNKLLDSLDPKGTYSNKPEKGNDILVLI